MSCTANFRIRIWICVLAPACFAVAADADTITINEVLYDNVLVSETDSLYYVTIPAQGLVISVAKDQVDKATLMINDDPYYRDDLKSQYRARKDAGKDGGIVGEGQSFSVAIQEGKSSGGGGPSFIDASGSGTGKSLGVSRHVVKGALEKAGYTFTGQGMVVEGKSKDGEMTVELHGTDAELTAIIAETSGPSGMIPLVTRVSALAPALGAIKNAQWSGGWIQQNIAEVFKFNTIQKTQRGVYIALEPSQRDTTAILKVTIRGA